MKKIVLVVVFAFAYVVTAFGQTDTNVSVTAEVLAGLTIDVTSNIDHGSISTGAPSVLNPTGGTLTSNNIGTSASQGVIELTDYNLNDDIQISFTGATLALSSDQNVTLSFTTVATWVDNGVNTTASEWGTGDTNEVTGSTTTLYLGGTLTTATTPGSYSTTNAGGSPVVVTIQNTSL